jgi:hypothetical protein
MAFRSFSEVRNRQTMEKVAIGFQMMFYESPY